VIFFISSAKLHDSSNVVHVYLSRFRCSCLCIKDKFPCCLCTLHLLRVSIIAVVRLTDYSDGLMLGYLKKNHLRLARYCSSLSIEDLPYPMFF